jgi:hypothetical protein
MDKKRILTYLFAEWFGKNSRNENSENWKMLTGKIKDEFTSLALALYLSIILVLTIVISIFFISKSYFNFIENYNNHLLFSFLGFGGLAVVAYLLLVNFLNTKHKVTKVNDIENEIIINQNSISRIALLFTEGFIESIIQELSKEIKVPNMEEDHEQRLPSQ